MIAGSEWLLIGAVAAVGVLHTIVPDHWVPITLIARQQGWSKREVARAAVIAGTGHTVSTLLIGLVVWIAGVAFATRFANFVSIVSSFALIAFGLWIALSSLREIRTSGGYGHSHRPGHSHGNVGPHGAPAGFHGTELKQIATDRETLQVSIFEAGTPPHFRLSGRPAERIWLETQRENGERQRFDFVQRNGYWESLDEIPEPHAFSVTVAISQGRRVQSYETTFAEHDHAHDEHAREADDALYAPSSAGIAVLTKYAHAHRHGRSTVHRHLHDHESEAAHEESLDAASDPPIHEHRHKRSLRTTLLLILGSSPMVEGIPAFFAAGKYGPGFIAVMAIVFAISTIATYVVLCVSSVAGLRQVRFGSLERYGEVLSGAFIAVVGFLFLIFPVL